jgi:hypothetical protein
MPQGERDPNSNAARIARETAARGEQPLPPEIEAAWHEWSSCIQNVDQRALTLLRAAFEAGYSAKRSAKELQSVPKKRAAAITLGRLGGLKGGKARADSLTPEHRAEIARKAAQTRWNGRKNDKRTGED